MSSSFGQCPACGAPNPYNQTLCSQCQARLPWAEALEQAHQSGWQAAQETTHEALKQDKLYLKVLELMQAALYQRDFRLKQLTVFGASIHSMTGYDTTELTAEVWVSLVQETIMRGPAAGLSLGEALTLSRAGQLPYWSADYRIRTRSGEERWVSDDSILLTDATGQRVASLGVLQDITVRKAIETQLRRREEYFRAVTENALDLISLLDAQGNALYQSPSLERVLGYRPDELIGQNVFALLHPDDRPAVVTLFADKVVEAAATATIQYRFRHKNGGWRWMESVANNQLHNPAVGAVVINSRDITERKQVEQALRESDERFYLVARATNEAIWDWDLRADTIWWSEGFQALFGYCPEQIQPGSESWTSRIHPEELERVTQGIHTIIESGQEMWTDEYRFRRADGTYADIFDRGYVLYDENRQPVRMVGSMLDITARKQSRAQLQEYAGKLERSNQELQEFAYVASHDLQEPLRKIQTFGDRLLSTRSHLLDETAHDYLQRMQNAAARMNLLTQDLLALSRVTTQSRPFKEVSLAEVVQGVLLDLELRIEQTGATVEVDPLPTIEADPAQMHQLLLNLINNALKFQRSGVPPIVRVQSQVLADSDLYRITVQDNGIGFDPKYVEKIFLPFQRLHGRSEYEGTGMGLAICRRIVERHNGSITAQSEPGAGTTFLITLPAKQNSNALTPEASSS
ncbi:MAG: PAS domain-containing protein [Abitibacteriaceae bacterium]|nr:PAS domain-containing protein [Abditibacteriaceae bacterium]